MTETIMQHLPDVRALLNHALKSIKQGWTQASYVEQDRKTEYGTSFCLIGAIRHAADLDGMPSYIFLQDLRVREAVDLLYEALPFVFRTMNDRRVGRDRLDALFEWNDHEKRTKAQVVSLVQRALGKIDE